MVIMSLVNFFEKYKKKRYNKYVRLKKKKKSIIGSGRTWERQRANFGWARLVKGYGAEVLKGRRWRRKSEVRVRFSLAPPL